VHGDFYVRHLLVDDKHHLSGIIDWGDMHLGDPAIDLSIAHSFLPVQAHNSFINVYGEISNDTWALAKLRAIYSSTLLVLFGHHSSDPSIMREGLRSLKVMVSTSCQ
jgi:aminoglycoside phosphotransferase (APT) family kinase protein